MTGFLLLDAQDGVRLAGCHPRRRARPAGRGQIAQVRIAIGTSGFSYPPWRGRFYPSDLPASRFLGFYAKRFETVELNASFYRMPSAAQLARWAAEVPAEFIFSLKAPRRITHDAKLQATGDLLSAFLSRTAELGAQLGPILFQLPPSLRCDAERLARFLEMLPRGLRAAFELRHPSWLEDERVLALLREHQKALCLVETDEAATPFMATTRYGYLRLRRSAYTPQELSDLARRIASQPWTEAFAYFKHEDEARGPLLAAQMRSLLMPEPRPAPELR